MQLIDSKNKVLTEMDRPESIFRSPKDQHYRNNYVSPDMFRYRSINANSNKQKSTSSSNFYPQFHRLRPETTKNQDLRALPNWNEAPKTTNTGAETSDRRVSLENSKKTLISTFVTPNKESSFALKSENFSLNLKRKFEELSTENSLLRSENQRLSLQNKEFALKESRLTEMYRNLEEKHNERKKHMKQLIEIISEKEKQLEKAKTLHFELVNKKFKANSEKSPAKSSSNSNTDSPGINHQKIIEYALFLENQLEFSEKRIAALLKDNEKLLQEQRQGAAKKSANVLEELKELAENVKTVELQIKQRENQYDNQFQNLEESEKKAVKSNIDDLMEEKQRLCQYITG